MQWRISPIRLLAPVGTAAIIGVGWCALDARVSSDARPLAEYPSHTAGARLAVILSGDPQAATPVRELARRLAGAGLPSLVVPPGDAQDTPSSSAQRVEGLLRDRLARWDRQRVLLVGYARGAGMAPFVANRIGHDLRDRIDGVVLVGLTPRVSFRRRWRDHWTLDPRPTDLPVLPELERLRGVPLLCLYHEADPGHFCASLDAASAHRVARPIPNDGERESDAVARQVFVFLR